MYQRSSSRELRPLSRLSDNCMDNLKKKITNHNSKVSKSAVGENDYNENYQAVVEEDWNPCNCQGGLRTVLYRANVK